MKTLATNSTDSLWTAEKTNRYDLVYKEELRSLFLWQFGNNKLYFVPCSVGNFSCLKRETFPSFPATCGKMFLSSLRADIFPAATGMLPSWSDHSYSGDDCSVVQRWLAVKGGFLGLSEPCLWSSGKTRWNKWHICFKWRRKTELL